MTAVRVALFPVTLLFSAIFLFAIGQPVRGAWSLTKVMTFR